MSELEDDYHTRGTRFDPETWNAAKERARSDGVRMIIVTSRLIQAYAEGLIGLPEADPVGLEFSIFRSARVERKIWNAAVLRAGEDDVSMSELIRRLVRSYGEHKLNLPETKLVYRD